MHYRNSALLIGLLFALYGSAEAQQQTGPYIQVSPTPSKLSVGGPGFVQVDANGIASVVAQAPGSGTVTNTSGALTANSMVVGNGGSDIKTVGGSIGGTFTTAGNVSLTGAGLGLTLAFPANGPFTYTFPLATSTLASLAGSETFTNKIYNGGQLSGTFSGNPTYTGVPLFTNLSAGTQVACLGLDAGFHLVTLNASCGSGGSSATGFGVDGGTAPQNVTASTTINAGAREVEQTTIAAAEVLTLPAITSFGNHNCFRYHDLSNTISGSNTVTFTANANDKFVGGSNGGSSPAFATPGMSALVCAIALSGSNGTWQIGLGTIAASSAPSNQFANGVTVNGLSYAQPAVTNLSGLGTGVATAAGNALSGAGGLTSTIASGATAMGTSAIASAACATVVTATATNTATTDVVAASFNGDPTAVTGYVPLTTGMLTIIAYPTANAVNFKVCNNTSSSITPGAITLNWRVAR